MRSWRIRKLGNGEVIKKKMKIHTSIENLPVMQNPVVTVGSFDGVHLGHRKILSFVKAYSVGQVATELVDGINLVLRN